MLHGKMETSTEDSPQPGTSFPDSPTHPPQISDHHDLLAQLHSLRQSYETLHSKSSTLEENLLHLQLQRDEALNQNSNLKCVVDEVSSERDSLRDQVRELEASSEAKEGEFAKRVDEELLKHEELEKQAEALRGRIEELEREIEETKQKNGSLSKSLDSMREVKHSLVKIIECLDDEKAMERVNGEEGSLESAPDDESTMAWEESELIRKLASEAESKVNEFKQMKKKEKKEKKELENSVVSLTEENRDINTLLRAALLEKEAVEKKLKGNDQKRVALLQFAERGLRVGFGFMMGGGTEHPAESSGATTPAVAASTTSSVKSDSSECEEETVSLASTVEKIMKNLRLEISQLRRSLEESRSDTERLQSLAEKQAQEIAENTLYIKELEDRERLLAQNVEDLLNEIKETEAEVARWREACELEVEAGKKEIGERDKVLVIMKQELEKTKAALDISNSKLKLKEELAAAAMAAQAAAEHSLQLADSRAAGLRQRIEELTKQLEETESRERSRRKVRHKCWPWEILRANATRNANARGWTYKRMLPEMESLTQYRV